MSIAIKFFFLFFLLVGSSTAKYLTPEDLFGSISADKPITLGSPLREIDKPEIINYFTMLFIRKIEKLQREADEKYPLWNSTNYLDRSLFLLEEAQVYVQSWNNQRKKRFKGNPYGDLRNSVQGDLWPMHYGYCRQSDGTSLLSYMMYDFCHQSERTNLLKYMTYGLSPEACLVP